MADVSALSTEARGKQEQSTDSRQYWGSREVRRRVVNRVGVLDSISPRTTDDTDYANGSRRVAIENGLSSTDGISLMRKHRLSGQRHSLSSAKHRNGTNDLEDASSWVSGTVDIPALRERVRKRSVSSPAASKSSMRSRLERPVLENLFRRNEGCVNRDQIRSAATLCGMPTCAAPMLFNTTLAQCSKRSTADGLQRCDTVDADAFFKLWESDLKNKTQDARLFHVMVHGASSAIHGADTRPSSPCEVHGKQASAPESLTADDFMLLAENLLNVLHTTLEARLTNECKALNRKALEGLIAGCLTSSLKGCIRQNALRVRLQDFERTSLCAALLAAENGRYQGPLELLRPDRFSVMAARYTEALRCDVGEARASDHVSSEKMVVCASGLAQFCIKYSMLTPKATQLFCSLAASGSGVCTSCSGRGVSAFAFTRMYLACTQVSKEASVRLLFDLIDVDMDGIVSAGDAQERYSEKVALYRQGVLTGSGENASAAQNQNHDRIEEVFALPDFEPTWYALIDMMPVNDRSRGFSKLELARASAATRAKVVQFLLFMKSDLAPSQSSARRVHARPRTEGMNSSVPCK